MSEKCHNNNSDNPLTSRSTNGGANKGIDEVKLQTPQNIIFSLDYRTEVHLKTYLRYKKYVCLSVLESISLQLT